MKARPLLKALVPPAVRRWAARCFPWRWFRGNYPSWAAARAAARGYDDLAIRERAAAAARAVRAGRGAWERDGAVFTTPAVHEPLLRVLLEAAERSGGRLDVVDVGGAFGSTWWQHRESFRTLRAVRWRVVEQPPFVQVGQAEFADEVLSFHPDVADAAVNPAEQFALLSAVLPYVERPEALLAGIAGLGFRDVVIDRTPFGVDGRRRLAVQHVPPALGGGSYPCWIFGADDLRGSLPGYRLVTTWPGFDQLDTGVQYAGLHFRKGGEP